MNTFESIRIQGFRRLENVEFNLKPLNVLIGANGCGKTSLLDVFTLLGKSAQGDLAETISDLGGVNENLTDLAFSDRPKAKFISIDLVMPVEKELPIDYRIALSQNGTGYEITDEVMSQEQGSSTPRSSYIDSHHGVVKYFVRDNIAEEPRQKFIHSESALSQVPRMFQPTEDLRNSLTSLSRYHTLDVSRRAPVRIPQPMRDARLPGKDGENLVSCLYTIRETDPDAFETVEDSLRAGFPNFERLNFPPVAAGVLAMTWKDKTSKHPFYMHQLSEGTLRFLWLVTLLNCPGLTAITLIDEPEVSLHPELLSLLADLMREASQRTQLIVATHSDRFIRYLKPEEVVTINLTDTGAAVMIRANELDLESWLQEYTLDEVWRMGRMGARS